MELSEQDIGILDRYLRNELSGDELLAFSERMKDSEFALEAKLYFESVQVIQHSGRENLRAQLKEIGANTDKSGQLEKYKPSKGISKGFSGSSFFITLFFISVISVLYYFYSDKLNSDDPEKINIQNSTDTVYHYKHTTDTVYIRKKDSVRKSTKRIIRVDTVYKSVKTRIKADSLLLQQFK